ncbi:MAG: hypothetical protein ACK47B_16830 [Armatimonadota bacterium]
MLPLLLLASVVALGGEAGAREGVTARPLLAAEPRPGPAPVRPVGSIVLGRRGQRDWFAAAPGRACYQLAWRDLHLGSESVLLDGRRLREGRDYQFDAARGTVTLLAPPDRERVLEVRYLRRPVFSEPADPVLRAPALAAPRWTETEGLRRRLAETLAAADASIGAPAPSSGVESAEALRDQLLSGLRQTVLQEELQGEPAENGSFTYTRSDALEPGALADEREEFRTQLNLRPNPGGRLVYSDYYSRGSLFSDSYEEAERRKLQFEQSWGKSEVGLRWERQRTDGYGVANALDALSLSFTRQFGRSSAEGLLAYENSLSRGWSTESLFSLRPAFTPWLKGHAGLFHQFSEYSGSTLESAASLTVSPGPDTEATVGIRQSDSELYGRYGLLSGQVTTTASDWLELTGEASRRDSDQFGAVNTIGLGLAARPTQRTLLEAAFSESTGAQLGRERTETLRLSADPAAWIRLQLGYDRLRSDDEGLSESTLWMLTLGGERYVRLEGYAGRHSLTEEELLTDALYRLEIRPWEPLAFSGSLRQVEGDEHEQSLAGIGASLRLLSILDVSAAFRRPTDLPEDQPELVGRDLSLSLTPVSGFRLFGQHSLRPEDSRGMLLDEAHHSFGLETRLGSFALQGMTTRMQGPVGLAPGTRHDLLASLELGSTRLFGGLRLEDTVPSDPFRRRVYRFGIEQSAGDSFFLLLEGQLGWVTQAGGSSLRDPSDTRAQARLGLRF